MNVSIDKMALWDAIDISEVFYRSLIKRKQKKIGVSFGLACTAKTINF